eukprot:4118422-Prymnesium_polylepis.1
METGLLELHLRAGSYTSWARPAALSFCAASLTASKLTGTSSLMRHSSAGTGTSPLGVILT